MKATRIFLLGFAIALLAIAATVESAEAQCWTCTVASMQNEGKPSICWICTGDRSGAAACSTMRCGDCDTFGDCRIAATLDGRNVPPELPALPDLDEVNEVSAFSAVFASADLGSLHRDAREARRSCDGGIIFRRYSPDDVRAARRMTAQLLL